MSLIVSFCAVFFPRDVSDEIWDLIESVSEGFPTYSCSFKLFDRINNFLHRLSSVNIPKNGHFTPLLLPAPDRGKVTKYSNKMC